MCYAACKLYSIFSSPSLSTESWKTLCRLRREKISSEEEIAELLDDLAETEESVTEREHVAERAAATVVGLFERIAMFRRWHCRIDKYLT